MWWFAAGAIGAQVLGGVAGYAADKKAAAAQRAYQEWRNTMTNISAAQNQNAITTNVSQQIIASGQQAAINQTSAIEQRAAAEASAAAAGVKGGSVEQTLFSFERAAANVEFRRQQDLQNAFLASDQQRRNTAMAAAMQQDYNFIKQPSLAGTLLGAAQSGLGLAASYFAAQDAMPQYGNSTSSGPAMHTRGTIAYAPTGGHGRLVP